MATERAKKLIESHLCSINEIKIDTLSPFTKAAKPSTLLGVKTLAAVFKDKSTAQDFIHDLTKAHVSKAFLSAPYEHEDGTYKGSWSVQLSKPAPDDGVSFVNAAKRLKGTVLSS